MSKFGENQINYESFKLMYDSDTKLQNLVKDFNEKGIRLKTLANSQDGAEVTRDMDQSKNRLKQTASKAAERGLKNRHS